MGIIHKAQKLQRFCGLGRGTGGCAVECEAGMLKKGQELWQAKLWIVRRVDGVDVPGVPGISKAVSCESGGLRGIVVGIDGK